MTFRQFAIMLGAIALLWSLGIFDPAFAWLDIPYAEQIFLALLAWWGVALAIYFLLNRQAWKSDEPFIG